jgi:hypothetical protein
MPRRAWRVRTRMAPLADPLRLFLETGDPGRGNLTLFLLARPGGAPEVLRPTWEQHRNKIMAAWLEECPGRRPYGWWYGGDAPEPRRVLQRAPATTCAVRRRAWGVAPLQPDIAITIESQATYLKRLDLLAPDEAARLTASDFAPVVLEPDEDEKEETMSATQQHRRFAR